MALAKTIDVSISLMRALTDVEEIAAARWLDRIESRILIRYPDLLTTLADDPNRTDAIIGVEADAVVRVLRNPNALRQFQGSIDDGSESGTIDSTLSSGQLYLTDAEWATVAECATATTLARVATAYTIGLGTPAIPCDNTWAGRW